ncbi:olfactory receptor 52D1-like [Gastrophryne carolinensis]
MENASSFSFVLLGLVEMQSQRYLFFLFSTAIYLVILMTNSIIVYVVLKERSLHQPMYTLIASLLLNEIFGSSSFFPKLMSDLITSTISISHTECLLQALCVSSFAFFEMNTFTIMAFDRYLAVCHPLQYFTLMTNNRALKVIAIFWVTSLLCLSIVVALGWNIPLCGNKINNIFCDYMSYVVLSCVDTSANRVHSAILTSVHFIITVLVTAVSYFKIYIISLKASRESHQKAVYTVVTHLLNFSIFLVGLLFVFLRYRFEKVTLPVTGHVFLSVTALVFPPICNPLIYGIRTHALKRKVAKYLGK